jgi:uncharacterized repeat protein (TIGR03803 family)
MHGRQRGIRSSLRALASAVATFAFLTSVSAKASSFEVLKAFRTNSAIPNPLCVGRDGILYGTTQDGGDHAQGEIFSLDQRGVFMSLHSFNGVDGATPLAALVEAGDGDFYGTTSSGGDYSQGTVFKINKNGAFTTLHSFVAADGAGAFAALVLGPDEALYGRSYGGAGGAGAVFRLEPGGSFSILRSFTSAEGTPEVMFRASDGALYGITQTAWSVTGYGTMFKVGAGGEITILHVFNGRDGGRPNGGFVQAVDGAFYGVATIRVYTIDTLGTLRVLHSYGNSPDILLASRSGGVYGTALETSSTGTNYTDLVKFDTSGVYKVLHAFYNPPFWMTEADDGTLYGMVYLDEGLSVFRLTQSGEFTRVYTFAQASTPTRELAFGSDGVLYGGSRSEPDGIFRLDTQGTFEVLHDFTGNDGTGPGPLVAGYDGVLYGATVGGGAHSGNGTIFRIDRDGTFTSLHSFSGFDGSRPWKLIRGNDGNVYGTSKYGEPYGTVFRVSADGSFTTLHSFDGIEGAIPRDLVQGSDGALYGATVSGSGVIYRVTPTGNFVVLHAFDGLDGRVPSRLIEGEAGMFYGVTGEGGPNGYGTVFRVDARGNFITLYSFKDSDGCGPDNDAGLTRGRDAALYGTTGGCDLTAGIVFRLDAHGHVVPFHKFEPATEGSLPAHGLVSGGDGALYGTTTSGAAHGAGAIFRLDAHRQLTVLHAFEFAPSGGPLLEGDDGAFYGALYTYQGDGIFRIDRDGRYAILHSFDFARDGGDPSQSLIKGAEGKLFGTASAGGPLAGGTVYGLSPYLGGDANGDFSLDVTDVFALIDYLFAGAPAPVPLLRADANGDGVVDVSDVFYLIQYLYAGGPPPA